MSIEIRLLMETATPEKKSWLRHCKDYTCTLLEHEIEP